MANGYGIEAVFRRRYACGLPNSSGFGSSLRLFNPNSPGNLFVVPYRIGRPGHSRHPREPFAPEQIERVEKHILHECPDCGEPGKGSHKPIDKWLTTPYPGPGIVFGSGFRTKRYGEPRC